MPPRSLSLSLSLLLAALLPLAAPAEQPSRPARQAQAKPNIILIFTDDQGYQDLGCFGSKLIKTPNIDRMASEGLKLTSFYAQPVCGVSRAALMTGCYPIRVAEPGNLKQLHTVPHPKEVTVAEVLKGAGYATALIGKWHLCGNGKGAGGTDPATMPNAQGFDHFYGTPKYNGFTVRVEDHKFRSPLLRNREVVVEAIESWDTITADYTREALEWIGKNKARPFFLYLAHNLPHIPVGASENFKGKSAYGPYGDTIEEIDWSTGEILRHLQKLELDQNTLVIFTSDNGPWVETTRAMQAGGKPFIPRDHSGSAEPLRGWKMSAWDGGSRVPFVARWPGQIPAGGSSDELLTTMDLLPTFAALAGAELPGCTLDGRDAGDFLLGKTKTSPRDEYLYYTGCLLTGVRVDDWKLVLPRPANPPGTGWWGRMIEAIPDTRLFDLGADPGETTDLAAKHPEHVARLMKRIERARAELGDIGRTGSGARLIDGGPRRLQVPIEGKRAAGATKTRAGDPPPVLFRNQAVTGIGREPDVCRRDPSDVIEFAGKHYVYYTKVLKGAPLYPSGYHGSVWAAVSEDAGRSWRELGEAVPTGAAGCFDSTSTFTPNILAWKNQFHLYYTAVGDDFSNKVYEDRARTAIGVATSGSPGGPWKKHPGPVLESTRDNSSFDSFRVDDSNMLIDGGRILMFYKGRAWMKTPAQTRMGVAAADSPLGPFTRLNGGKPVQQGGHEVLVFRHDDWLWSLTSPVGKTGNRLLATRDPLSFTRVAGLPQPRPPHAPGLFRPELTGGKPAGRTRWGIAMASYRGDPFLQRFEFDLPSPPQP